jgi:hypothetical protein
MEVDPVRFKTTKISACSVKRKCRIGGSGSDTGPDRFGWACMVAAVLMRILNKVVLASLKLRGFRHGPLSQISAQRRTIEVAGFV